MREVDFYFDFMSPFAYLAHLRLPDIAKRHGLAISYRPVDLAQLKIEAGNTGPPNRQVPAKLKYLLEDVARWADRYGEPFVLPRLDTLDSRLANQGARFVAKSGAGQSGKMGEFVSLVWRASFGSGGSMADKDSLAGIAASLDLDRHAFLDFIGSPGADRDLSDRTTEAAQRGIFGVPTMIVDGLMWWGNDRLAFLEDHLAQDEP